MSDLSSDPLPAKPRRGLRAAVGGLGVAAGGAVLLGLTLWAGAALYFDGPVRSLRAPVAAFYILGLIAAWFLAKHRGRAVLVALVGFAFVLGWWRAIPPSNNRDWQPDVAVLPYGEVDGSHVTVHHIRNCEYRSETDFDVRHYDRTFDLDGLRSVDLFMVYWGSPHMAHTMMSFGFADGAQLCFSIETRKEKGEQYSAVKGLFRQFELTYVASDERDVVRLRTNYRKGEDVYLYRLNATPAQTREFFLSYLRTMNDLARAPRWYNAATHNCTLGIRLQRAVSDRAPWDWRMLVNGHGDTMLYERGMIPTSLPLAQLKQLAHINERARSAGDAADFSRTIRRGVPGINP